MDDNYEAIKERSRGARIFSADNLFYIIIIPLTGYLVYYAIATLQWRIDHDLSVFTYMAYLINNLGFVPYRDIFEVQMPGTFLLFSLLGWISGYSDLGFRIIDLVYLAIIAVGTWFFLRKINWRVAWAAPVLFSILYLGEGPKMSLEREYVMLPFIISAVVFATSFKKLHYGLRSSIIGLAIGLAFLIKPQAIIILPIVLTFSLFVQDNLKRNDIGRSLIGVSSAFVGLLIPILVTSAYLWWRGAFFPFIDVIINYWPLYGDLGPGHRIYTLSGLIKIYLLCFRNFGNFGIWAITAVTSTIFCLRFFDLGEERKKLVFLLTALAATSYIYPALSGQFFFYHWLPFLYFAVILTSLCLSKPLANLLRRYMVIPVCVLVLACFISFKLPFGGFRNIYGDYEKVEPWGGRADEIGSYLTDNLEPGDKVQPLDWICGAAHGLLIARAELATKHLYDFDFYHHISEDYIQKLREGFIRDLYREEPRFIVEVPEETFTRCHGPDTTTEFPELREIIDNDYIEVASGDGYIIYERKN